MRAAADSISAMVLGKISERNQQFFLDAVEKLDNRAADLKNGLESEIKLLDRDIRGKRTEARTVTELEAKLVLHRKITQLERERNRKRKGLFEMQDQIDSDKEALIDDVQLRLRQDTESMCLFRLRWAIS